ncbi:hypothetical protein KR222_003444 [Zaprionus bogoriensis]|nr:hypothetical protein KR222_003444 [Zaprionus bogoriensis]
MQLREQPQSMLWKIAFLIIALVGDVSCIRNGDANDEQKHISAKLKNFFPSEPAPATALELSPASSQAEHSRTSQPFARVSNGGFRPSQMLEFTPSDVMHSGFKRYPPSYLEPNYKHQVPNSLTIDKQFSFPEDGQATVNRFTSTQIPTTPVVSYLDPFTQHNYGYTPTPAPTLLTTPPPYRTTYLREQSEGQKDQVYTVQSSLLVGNHSPQQNRPGTVEDVYLKRPGYVFDESPSPSSAVFRRPAATTASSTPANKISYDSHDYPPPSYAAQQTSNFVPQKSHPTTPSRPLPSVHPPPYNRQDVNDNRPLAGSSIHEAAYASQPQFSSPHATSNYANNFGNYLPHPLGYPNHPPSSHHSNPAHYQYEPLGSPSHQQQPQRPGHNYYEYQIGEIPPQPQLHQQDQFNYRPRPGASYRPTYQEVTAPGPAGGGGFATLASLLSSTQQYAPQFTNLLLGGPSSPSSSSSSPLGSLLGAFAGAQQQQQQQPSYASQRPPNTQLIRALENIARNDDLQCVPKVLCQMIAGQTLRGQLPGFITSPAIANFLAGFPVASPALIYGRAALLGISGGERSCVNTYEKCPKNEMEIIHYLNNHRGGFFKFFSEPEELPTESHPSEAGGGSLFSILSALTGGGQTAGQGHVTRTTQRPVFARPTQRPSTDIADGIGSFFNRVLSEYLSGVEFQRRRRRRSLLTTEIKRNIQTGNKRLMPVDFHDAEDDLDTQTPVKFQDDDEAEEAQAHTELEGVLQFPEDEGEGRILHFKTIQSEEEGHDGTVRFPDAMSEAQVIYEFNRNAAQRKLRFPQDTQDRGQQVSQAQKPRLAEGWEAVVPNELSLEDYGVEKRRGKRIVFRDTNEEVEESDERLKEEQARDEEDRLKQLSQLVVPTDIHLGEQQEEYQQYTAPNALNEEAAPPQRGARVIFPDHYEKYIRRGKILPGPTYAPDFQYDHGNKIKEERLVVSDQHRPSSHYRLDSSDFHTHSAYVPGSTVRFEESNYRPSFNYPNTHYVSDNRYSSGHLTSSTRRPKHEDDKNIYVTNSQGVTEYYIRPDGRKVYLGSA